MRGKSVGPEEGQPSKRQGLAGGKAVGGTVRKGTKETKASRVGGSKEGAKRQAFATQCRERRFRRGREVIGPNELTYKSTLRPSADLLTGMDARH